MIKTMRTMNATSRRRRRGQVAVETALVMPFFVFYIMGTIQLSLLHQARLMTKYASYKAARTGSIHNAKMAVMKKAALAAVLPFAGTGAPKGEHVFKTGNVTDFGLSYQLARANVQGMGTPIVDVTICNPTKDIFNQSGEDFMDFDNPKVAPITGEANADDATSEERNSNDKEWKPAWATRLNVQVTFYHRMVIPFANGMIWWMAMAKEDQETLRVLRMGSKNRESGGGTNKFNETTQIKAQKGHPSGQEYTLETLMDAARAHIYIMPIRASYGMRMQSNFFPSKAGFELPTKNECHIPFAKKGS